MTIKNYNIYVSTPAEKYAAMNLIKDLGGVITGASGCGDGYYIQLDATPAQAARFDCEWPRQRATLEGGARP